MFQYTFISCCIICIFCSFFMICQKNVMHALCNLMIVFGMGATIIIMFDADFLAFSYIIIYIGAISIFFLFAVMLIDLRSDEIIKQTKSIIFIFSCFLLLADYIFYIGYKKYFIFQVFLMSQHDIIGDTFLKRYNDLYLLSQLLYNEFSFITIIIGLLLFISMISILILTFEFAKAFTKRQFIYEQIKRNPNRAIFLKKN